MVHSSFIKKIKWLTGVFLLCVSMSYVCGVSPAHAQESAGEGTSGACTWKYEPVFTEGQEQVSYRFTISPTQGDNPGFLGNWEESTFSLPPWQAPSFSDYRSRTTCIEIARAADGSKPVKALTCVNMFKDFTALIIADLSGLDVASVTNMSSMFSGCEALISFDSDGFDTSSVRTMSSMFKNCGALFDPGGMGRWNTSNVVDMSYLFCGCSSLSMLSLKEWSTSSNPDMTGMFDTYGLSGGPYRDGSLSCLCVGEDFHFGEFSDPRFPESLRSPLNDERFYWLQVNCAAGGSLKNPNGKEFITFDRVIEFHNGRQKGSGYEIYMRFDFYGRLSTPSDGTVVQPGTRRPSMSASEFSEESDTDFAEESDAEEWDAPGPESMGEADAEEWDVPGPESMGEADAEEWDVPGPESMGEADAEEWDVPGPESMGEADAEEWDVPGPESMGEADAEEWDVPGPESMGEADAEEWDVQRSGPVEEPKTQESSTQTLEFPVRPKTRESSMQTPEFPIRPKTRESSTQTPEFPIRPKTRESSMQTPEFSVKPKTRESSTQTSEFPVRPNTREASTATRQDERIGWHKHGNMVFCYRDGKKLTGWQELRGTIQDPSSLQKSWFYFDDAGVMLKGQHELVGGFNGRMNWFYFDEATGAEIRGWKYIDYQDKWCYYSREDGTMLKGQHRLQGGDNGGMNWFYFDEVTGAEFRNCWKEIPSQKKSCYYGSDGAMYKGWREIGGKYYYFDEVTGALT